MPRTFVFLDLSGFTNYTAAYGDEAAGRILSTFRTLVREVSSERGVRMPSFFGYMAYSGAVLIPLFVVVTWIFFF